jgi:alpha-1,2-mannosyltransferase
MGGRAVVGWVAGLCLITLLVLLIGTKIDGSLVDLTIYRAGGAAWLDGIPLYTNAFPAQLPFTYPPLSAVVFSLLAAVSWPLAIVMITIAGLLALSATVVLAAPMPARRALPVATVAVVFGFALEPVRETLSFGQINLVLMGLVALDCLLPRTRYPRGMLIGLAAALKLTPIFFVVFFLARREIKPAMTAVGTAVGVSGIAALAAPHDSLTYWTSTILHADRIGGASFATNQSLRGALHRLDLSPIVVQACWCLLVAGVLALAWVGARRAHQAGDRVGALLVVAAAGLLVSPVSWSHHWVWIVPALVVGWLTVYRRARAGWPVVALLAVTIVFTIGQRVLPHAEHREVGWAWWQHVAGNSYLIIGLAFVIWSAFARRTEPAPAPPARVERRAEPTPEPA